MGHENGLTCKEGLTVEPCPAPGHAHVNNSGVERRVKAIKESFGSLDLEKTPMEATRFYNLLILLETSLNNLPIYYRSHPKDKNLLNNVITKIITPSSLCGRHHNRSSGTIFLQTDIKLFNKNAT